MRMLVDGHQSDPGSLEPDADGWYHARCTCGFRFGPLPDVETVADVLMEHAADRSYDTEGS